MTDIDLSSYTLVKDKDGQLKYYKDGQFLDMAEMATLIQQSKAGERKVAPKIDIRPVLSLIDKKKPVELKSPRTNGVEERVEVETDPVLNIQRNADQKAIEERVQSIISQLKITFADEIIERRFLNILTTYFRGIRGEKEIEYILTLSKISGGMELPVDKAKLVVSLLQHQLQELINIRKNIAVKPTDDIQMSTDMQHRLAPPPPTVFTPVAPTQTPSPAPQPMVRTMVPPPVVKPTNVVAPVSARPVVRDVKPAQRQLTGPLEELEYMTLDDFRKLGRNETEIRDEILERINLLSDQSFVKKVQGIKAWKKSPVFRMYLMLSLVGIQNGKSVMQVIEDKQVQHEDSLTLSEFEIINELNNKLRF